MFAMLWLDSAILANLAIYPLLGLSGNFGDMFANYAMIHANSVILAIYAMNL